MGHCVSLESHSDDHQHGEESPPNTTDPFTTDYSKICLEYQGDAEDSDDTKRGMSEMSACEKFKGDHDKHYWTLESFSQDNLPPGFKDGYDLIKVISNQTCIIEVEFVSQNRPRDYPSFEFRGQEQLRVGSGCIHINKIKLKDVTDWYYSKFAPDTPDSDKRTVYGTFNIQTAKHVIFDEEEMKRSTIYFFYDSDDESQRVMAKPVEVLGRDTKDDRIDIRCVTFDAEFGSRMEKVKHERNRLWHKFTEKPKDEEHKNDFIAVCISHIHGSFKRISIGKVYQIRDTRRNEGRMSWCCFKYDTPTCKGSSGAPVWISNQDGSFYSMAPHSHHIQEKGTSHSARGVVHEKNPTE